MGKFLLTNLFPKDGVLLFNPGDNYTYVQSDDGTLDYRGFNITKEVMLDLAEEVTCCLRPLHELVMKGSNEFGKEKICYS